MKKLNHIFTCEESSTEQIKRNQSQQPVQRKQSLSVPIEDILEDDNDHHDIKYHEHMNIIPVVTDEGETFMEESAGVFIQQDGYYSFLSPAQRALLTEEEKKIFSSMMTIPMKEQPLHFASVTAQSSSGRAKKLKDNRSHPGSSLVESRALPLHDLEDLKIDLQEVAKYPAKMASMKRLAACQGTGVFFPGSKALQEMKSQGFISISGSKVSVSNGGKGVVSVTAMAEGSAKAILQAQAATAGKPLKETSKGKKTDSKLQKLEETTDPSFVSDSASSSAPILAAFEEKCPEADLVSTETILTPSNEPKPLTGMDAFNAKLEDILTQKLEQNGQAIDEKTLMKKELLRSMSLREKLENLCRELQQENKRIKKETQKLALLEQKKRDDLSAKFELAIQEITFKMQDSTEETLRRVQDNEKLKEKFYGFLEQYELREKHFNSVVKTKDLELKLYNAKLAQQTSLTENGISEIQALKCQLELATQSECSLKEQLSHYIEKFKAVEETLSKSNDLFSLFRQEMESMTTRLGRLEKEKSALSSHCASFQKNCLELFHEKNSLAETLESTLGKKEKLEILCRALQSERKKWHKCSCCDGGSFSPESSAASTMNNHLQISPISSPSDSTASLTNSLAHLVVLDQYQAQSRPSSPVT